MLGKDFGDWHFEIYFLFSQKTEWYFKEIDFLREIAWKYQTLFSEKNKKIMMS